MEKKKDKKEEVKFDKPTEIQDRISQANAAASRLEKANEQKEKLLKQEADLQAEKILSGSADAGSEVKQQTDDEKEIAAARKLLEGTGYDDQLFPEKKE